MVNRIRGEAELCVGNKRWPLLLTLGALAQIEDELGLENLSAIGPRLCHTRAADLAIVTAALIRGGGGAMTAADVLALPCPLGLLMAGITEAFARAGLPETQTLQNTAPGRDETGRPFAGPTSSPLASGG